MCFSRQSLHISGEGGSDFNQNRFWLASHFSAQLFPLHFCTVSPDRQSCPPWDPFGQERIFEFPLCLILFVWRLWNLYETDLKSFVQSMLVIFIPKVTIENRMFKERKGHVQSHCHSHLGALKKHRSRSGLQMWGTWPRRCKFSRCRAIISSDDFLILDNLLGQSLAILDMNEWLFDIDCLCLLESKEILRAAVVCNLRHWPSADSSRSECWRRDLFRYVGGSQRQKELRVSQKCFSSLWRRGLGFFRTRTGISETQVPPILFNSA